MKPMLRLLCLLTLLVSATVPLLADTRAPASFSLRFGVGLTQVWDDELSDTLKSLGQSAVDPATLIPTSWALSFNFGGLETDVSSTHTTNTLFGAQSGSHRTRLVIDSADLAFGSRWPLGPNVFVTGGLGLDVSQLELQTYNGSSTSLGGALSQTGQVSLVSSWNWSPIATARLGWRFAQLAKSPYGWTVALGVTASDFIFPVRWKMANDVAVSGIDKPWGPSLRPMLWIGVE